MVRQPVAMTTQALQERLRARRELPPPEARKAIRVAAGARLEDIADALGCSRQAVAHWEAGERFPRDRWLRAYNELLRALSREMAS